MAQKARKDAEHCGLYIEITVRGGETGLANESEMGMINYLDLLRDFDADNEDARRKIDAAKAKTPAMQPLSRKSSRCDCVANVRSRKREVSSFHSQQRGDRLYVRTCSHAFDAVLYRPRGELDCLSTYVLPSLRRGGDFEINLWLCGIRRSMQFGILIACRDDLQG